ncbi:MAG: hypothetical protein KGL39_45390 [Patescibacteria group bacterium]|nr:hypothetical protein [Patescibacteria group bacterium]
MNNTTTLTMPNKFKPITVFARKEHTHELPAANPKEVVLMDVQIYKDRARKIPFARFLWWHTNKPTRRNRWVTLNCFRYRLVWI